MVYRIFVEKKPGFDQEAEALRRELTDFLGVASLTGLRMLNRYDAEGISKDLFDQAVRTVFSEPQVDMAVETPDLQGGAVFAVEYLPGQFDQRADSAAQCIQLISQGERPLIRSARVYVLYGDLTEDEIAEIKKYVVNPVEAREASLEKPETLRTDYAVPTEVKTLTGFQELDREGLAAFVRSYGLAMDIDDVAFCQRYFADEGRDPTITEIRMIDTYWSDHCRHTTFLTEIDGVTFEDELLQKAYESYLDVRRELHRTKPICLMDIATIAVKYLKAHGRLPKLDESEEINACTVKMEVEADGQKEPWLLLFKNETHNHPTEIEPFGGAATCIGGCIRDPLSGRVYVHQAMRVTGGGDPRVSFADTTPGKLPQRKLATTAAAGYSSYGNQIGLATGHVAEVYHDGYIAKRLECGAVVGAAPADHVRREVPAPGDVVILLGGRTGRDGIGGATGSSKSHNMKSLTTMASEVQKGNAPEERKIQRLFRDGEVTRLIKRCNDFGAGGVSVAIGELADGLKIDLDAVRKKYDGLDGTELAISESQERMAVVVDPADADKFIAAAEKENLEAYRVAVVTEEPRMVMTWRGETIANLSREFLNTNGAVKTAKVFAESDKRVLDSTLQPTLRELASNLKFASRRGLVERFDGSIGAGSVLMPFGGKTQRTPAQAMAALFPVEPGQTTDQASIMAWGFDPDQMSADPYTGAQASIITSMAKIVAAGADYKKAYLTLQEFFEKLRQEPNRWGKPFQALLGALEAQLGLEAAAIGGKDSMSGSFLDMDVPPTLISFAIAPAKAEDVLSPEFKEAGHPVYLFGAQDLMDYDGHKDAWECFHDLAQAGKVKAAWAVEAGGVAEAVMKMSFGNGVGFKALENTANSNTPGMIVAELTEDVDCAVKIGVTTDDGNITFGGETVSIDELLNLNDSVLEKVYATDAPAESKLETFSYTAGCTAAPAVKCAKPKALIPVFPGTNCEYDTARAVMEAGGDAEILVIRNLTASQVTESAERFAKAIANSQMIVIPGGFSGGDEPDGSGKFITSFFRSPAVREEVTRLLENRDGLMAGICNGFQALIKLGLVPFGKIVDADENCPTLTYNTIGRHQSSIVRTRICTNKSPWLAETQVGQIYSVPISHGEGRFVAPEEVIRKLAENGQITTQYVDLSGVPTMDTAFNPNGSLYAIEGITSPDGRVLGKMGHSERVGKHLYKNIPGEFEMGMFRSAVKYFK